MISYSKIFIIGLLVPIFLIACSNNEKNNAENITKFEKIDANSFNKMIQINEDVQLIDVRTSDEYLSGHILNSKNIDIYESNFENEISKLDKDKPVLVYCRSGGRSSTASNMLKKIGFNFIYDLEGGITSWKTNNYNIVTTNSNSKNIIKGLSLSDYNNIISNKDKLVLVDFNAEWCVPCKKLAPILEKLAKENKSKLELVKIDVDNNPLIAKEMKVQGLPTLILYKNGVEVWGNLGLTDKNTILNVIEEHS